MAENEMKAMCGLPVEVRSTAQLGFLVERLLKMEIKSIFANGDSVVTFIENVEATDMIVFASNQVGVGSSIAVMAPRPLTEGELLLGDQHALVLRAGVQR